MKTVFLALAAIIGCALAPALAASWPEVVLPPDSRGELVSGHMKNNGLDMRVSRFDTPLSVDEIVEFYRGRWGDEHVVDQFDGKTIVGRAQGKHYVTVELEPKGGATSGTIGIMKMPEGRIDYVLGEGFLQPPGTEVFNDIRYYDTPRETRTIGMRNMQTPYANFEFYSLRLRARDWQREQDEGSCQRIHARCVANFSKGKEKIALTMTRAADFSTVIVANIE